MKRNFSKNEWLRILRDIASTKNGKILSEEYVNANSNLRWRCILEHEWDATPSRILHGRWCHICGGTKKKTIEDCHDIAKKTVAHVFLLNTLATQNHFVGNVVNATMNGLHLMPV